MVGRRRGILCSLLESSTGSHITKAVCLLLVVQLPLLGAPAVAIAQSPPPAPPAPTTIEQVWLNGYQVGFADGASCTPQVLFHGCPARPAGPPGPPIPTDAVNWQNCVQNYQAGYQAGHNTVEKQLDAAYANGAKDAAACKTSGNYHIEGACSTEMEERYRAGYGTPEEGCRAKEKAAQEQAAMMKLAPPPPATPPPAPPAGSSSVAPPPPPAPEPEEGEAATPTEGPNMGGLFLLLGAIAVGGFAAYEVGVAMKNASTGGSGSSGNCSTWGAANCPIGGSSAATQSGSLCYCCQVLNGSCQSCGSGSCIGFCQNNICYFNVGGTP